MRIQMYQLPTLIADDINTVCTCPAHDAHTLRDLEALEDASLGAFRGHVGLDAETHWDHDEDVFCPAGMTLSRTILQARLLIINTLALRQAQT